VWKKKTLICTFALYLAVPHTLILHRSSCNYCQLFVSECVYIVSNGLSYTHTHEVSIFCLKFAVIAIHRVLIVLPLANIIYGALTEISL
jgi:hypothetical protein